MWKKRSFFRGLSFGLFDHLEIKNSSAVQKRMEGKLPKRQERKRENLVS
jgi:hypothetical protein